MKPHDVSKAIQRIYLKYQKGQIDSDKVTKEVMLLNSLLKAIELSDLDERIKKLEDEMLSSRK